MGDVSEIRWARGRELDRLVHMLLALDRRRRWRWSPGWLRFWPFWESDGALRVRAERARTRWARRGTDEGMREEIAEVIGCDPAAVHIDVVGPGEFVVAVPRRLGFDERHDVERVVAAIKPLCTRFAIREGQ